MALAGLLLFVAGLCLGPMQETDLFFRIASGDQLLRTGRILHRNLFSFTYPDATYLDPAWLFDFLVAGLYRLGGFTAITLAKTALLLGVAFSAYRICRRRGASDVVAAFVLGLAFFCMRERLVERPHVVSLLCEVALLGLLDFHERRRFWLVIPLVALWANLHAGAFVGPVILGLAGLGALLDGERTRGWRSSIAAAATTIALLATPVGVGIVRYLAFHVGIFDIHPVDEFRSLTWRSDAPFVLFAAGALALVARPGPAAWQARLLAVGVSVLAVWHVRFSADATLILALLAAPRVPELWERITRAKLTRPALLVAFLATAIVPRAADARRGGRVLSLGMDESALPLDALRFADEHDLRERMYNDFEFGAYLIWRDYPRHRVFVDPRLPAYPLAFHQLLGRMDMSRTEWTRAMTELGVESALLDYAGINRRSAYWDPEDWALVFRAKDSRVFVRRLPKWKELIARFEIPATFEFAVESGAVTLPLFVPPSQSPVPACEWQIRLGDLYFDLDGAKSERASAAYRAALTAPVGCLPREHERAAAVWIGALDVARGRFAEALPLVERALAIAPDDIAVLTNQALALAGVGRASESRSVWVRIATLAAGTELGRRAADKAAIPP